MTESGLSDRPGQARSGHSRDPRPGGLLNSAETEAKSSSPRHSIRWRIFWSSFVTGFLILLAFGIAIWQVNRLSGSAMLYPILLGVLAVVVGIVLTGRTARDIAQPVEQLTEGATRLAAGALDERVKVEGQDELGQLAVAFNRMADQLQASYVELEHRVAERTADLRRRAIQLQTAAEVARDATAVLDPLDLMSHTVRLISQEFGFYHTGIFLLDKTGQWAVLRAASSEGGRRLLARGHRLRVGEMGIVGHVMATGSPRIATDTGRDAVFFDNPSLPETRSELALPLRAWGEIIGVLDVQSTEPAAFAQEDAAVLQILADQVGVGISNARLYQQAQGEGAATRQAYGQYSREAWQRMGRRGMVTGYRYEAGDLQADPQAWTPAMREALLADQVVQSTAQPAALAIPVRARGQTVGVVDITRPGKTDEWSAEQITLLETLADQLGVALDIARIYQETQRRAAREQLTREVADTIRSAVTVEDAIQRAIGEMGQVLGVSEMVARVGIEQDLLSAQGGDGHE